MKIDAADDRHVFEYAFVAHAEPLLASIEQRFGAP
jgi:hypothetical protein